MTNRLKLFQVARKANRSLAFLPFSKFKADLTLLITYHTARTACLHSSPAQSAALQKPRSSPSDSLPSVQSRVRGLAQGYMHSPDSILRSTGRAYSSGHEEESYEVCCPRCETPVISDHSELNLHPQHPGFHRAIRVRSYIRISFCHKQLKASSSRPLGNSLNP